MTGRERLVGAEHSLMLGPVAMSRAMGVKYDTYKNWKADRTSMPAVAIRCLELLIDHPKAARALGGSVCRKCGASLNQIIPKRGSKRSRDIEARCPGCDDPLVLKWTVDCWRVWTRSPKK